MFENEYKFPEHQVLDNGRPRLMDPVNPYNNFAKNWSEKSIEWLKYYANVTNRRLQILADGKIAQLSILFEPQPHMPLLSELFPYGSNYTQWLVGCLDYNSLPDLKIRNNKFLEEPRRRNGLEILRNYFHFMIYAVMASPNCSEMDVKKSIQDLISSHVINTKIEWVSSAEKHEDFDVTFTVPFSNARAIRISYRL